MLFNAYIAGLMLETLTLATYGKCWSIFKFTTKYYYSMGLSRNEDRIKVILMQYSVGQIIRQTVRRTGITNKMPPDKISLRLIEIKCNIYL